MTLCAYRPDTTTLKRTVAPTVEPLTDAQALEHVRLQDPDDLAQVQEFLAAALARIEAFTERALLTQTWTLKLDGWWTGDLELPKPPLQSVTSIVYATDAGTATATVSTDVYEVDTDSEPGRVRLKPNQVWPAEPYDRPNCITITFVAGWAAATSVPADIRNAARLLLGHYDQNREAVVTGTIATMLPETIADLLSPWRMPWD